MLNSSHTTDRQIILNKASESLSNPVNKEDRINSDLPLSTSIVVTDNSDVIDYSVNTLSGIDERIAQYSMAKAIAGQPELPVVHTSVTPRAEMTEYTPTNTKQKSKNNSIFAKVRGLMVRDTSSPVTSATSSVSDMTSNLLWLGVLVGIGYLIWTFMLKPAINKQKAINTPK